MGQIIRVYTGSDNESHFEELTPDQFADIATTSAPATSPSAAANHPVFPITTTLPAGSTS